MRMAFLMIAGLAALGAGGEAPAAGGEHGAPVLGYTVKKNDGTPVKLSQYRGSVLMIVNTASKCGYTPQYAGLEKLYQKYKDRGLKILAFPANNFGAQEPGTDTEIRNFCSTKYNVTFDLFSKISVKGEDKAPLYQYLTEHEKDPALNGDIKWNFQKFLVNRKGEVVARFDPGDEPMSPKVTATVEKLLAEGH
jgi:glutathione peroxidase